MPKHQKDYFQDQKENLVFLQKNYKLDGTCPYKERKAEKKRKEAEKRAEKRAAAALAKKQARDDARTARNENKLNKLTEKQNRTKQAADDSAKKQAEIKKLRDDTAAEKLKNDVERAKRRDDAAKKRQEKIRHNKIQINVTILLFLAGIKITAQNKWKKITENYR